MKSIESLRDLMASFEGVRWASAGVRELAPGAVAWVKFQLEKSENGWRSLEFFTWCLQSVSGHPPSGCLYPVTAPPTLNEPGESICFVFEILVGDEQQDAVAQTVTHLSQLKEKDWPQCRA